MYLASVQDKAVYKSFGLDYQDDDQLSSTSDDELADCEWDSDEDNQDLADLPQKVSGLKAQSLSCDGVSMMDSRLPPSHSDVDDTHSQTAVPIKQNEHATATIIDPDVGLQKKQNITLMDAPSFEHLLYILREVKLNWFALAGELKITLGHFTPEALSQLLLDFTDWLPHSNLKTDEEVLVEQSRQAFLEAERQRIINGQQLTD